LSLRRDRRNRAAHQIRNPDDFFAPYDDWPTGTALKLQFLVNEYVLNLAPSATPEYSDTVALLETSRDHIADLIGVEIGLERIGRLPGWPVIGVAEFYRPR